MLVSCFNIHNFIHVFSHLRPQMLRGVDIAKLSPQNTPRPLRHCSTINPKSSSARLMPPSNLSLLKSMRSVATPQSSSSRMVFHRTTRVGFKFWTLCSHENIFILLAFGGILFLSKITNYWFQFKKNWVSKSVEAVGILSMKNLNNLIVLKS